METKKWQRPTSSTSQQKIQPQRSSSICIYLLLSNKRSRYIVHWVVSSDYYVPSPSPLLWALCSKIHPQHSLSICHYSFSEKSSRYTLLWVVTSCLRSSFVFIAFLWHCIGKSPYCIKDLYLCLVVCDDRSSQPPLFTGKNSVGGQIEAGATRGDSIIINK